MVIPLTAKRSIKLEATEKNLNIANRIMQAKAAFENGMENLLMWFPAVIFVAMFSNDGSWLLNNCVVHLVLRILYSVSYIFTHRYA